MVTDIESFVYGALFRDMVIDSPGLILRKVWVREFKIIIRNGIEWKHARNRILSL